jgi:hypothetical protein
VTAIVIAYEDAYHEELHRLVKALRRDRGLPGLILEAQPVPYFEREHPLTPAAP